jgi:hypothetical protein
MHVERARIGDAAAVRALVEEAAEFLSARGIRQWIPGALPALVIPGGIARGEVWVVRSGAELLAWARDEARARARTSLRLDCVAFNTFLRRYYAGAGFEERGEVDLGRVRLAHFELRVVVALVVAFAIALGSRGVRAGTARNPDDTPVTPSEAPGVPTEKLSTDVQSATSADLDRSQTLDVSAFLSRNASGVTLNAAQNNPLQPDLQFRGFTASPLLGLSQGISVYQDGVRLNEVFGDTVNWDLISESAIERVDLIAGSSPLFGQNALGGGIKLSL